MIQKFIEEQMETRVKEASSLFQELNEAASRFNKNVLQYKALVKGNSACIRPDKMSVHKPINIFNMIYQSTLESVINLICEQEDLDRYNAIEEKDIAPIITFGHAMYSFSKMKDPSGAYVRLEDMSLSDLINLFRISSTAERIASHLSYLLNKIEDQKKERCKQEIRGMLGLYRGAAHKLKPRKGSPGLKIEAFSGEYDTGYSCGARDSMEKRANVFHHLAKENLIFEELSDVLSHISKQMGTSEFYNAKSLKYKTFEIKPQKGAILLHMPLETLQAIIMQVRLMDIEYEEEQMTALNIAWKKCHA